MATIWSISCFPHFQLLLSVSAWNVSDWAALWNWSITDVFSASGKKAIKILLIQPAQSINCPCLENVKTKNKLSTGTFLLRMRLVFRTSFALFDLLCKTCWKRWWWWLLLKSIPNIYGTSRFWKRLNNYTRFLTNHSPCSSITVFKAIKFW